MTCVHLVNGYHLIFERMLANYNMSPAADVDVERRSGADGSFADIQQVQHFWLFDKDCDSGESFSTSKEAEI